MTTALGLAAGVGGGAELALELAAGGVVGGRGLALPAGLKAVLVSTPGRSPSAAHPEIIAIASAVTSAATVLATVTLTVPDAARGTATIRLIDPPRLALTYTPRRPEVPENSTSSPG